MQFRGFRLHFQDLVKEFQGLVQFVLFHHHLRQEILSRDVFRPKIQDLLADVMHFVHLHLLGKRDHQFKQKTEIVLFRIIDQVGLGLFFQERLPLLDRFMRVR